MSRGGKCTASIAEHYARYARFEERWVLQRAEQGLVHQAWSDVVDAQHTWAMSAVHAVQWLCGLRTVPVSELDLDD